MKKADFARLCGVSGAMVSKYLRLGLIVECEGGVDAAESLRRLEGRLDEDKRVAAIVALADGRKSPPRPASKPAAATHAAPAGEAAGDMPPGVVSLAEFAAARQSDKARRERIEADRAEIELMQLTGRLVDALDVAREIENSVSVFWGELTRRERGDADEMAARLGLDQVRVRQLRDEVRRRNLALRKDFADCMMKLASGFRGEAEKPAPVSGAGGRADGDPLAAGGE